MKAVFHNGSRIKSLLRLRSDSDRMDEVFFCGAGTYSGKEFTLAVAFNQLRVGALRRRGWRERVRGAAAALCHFPPLISCAGALQPPGGIWQTKFCSKEAVKSSKNKQTTKKQPLKLLFCILAAAFPFALHVHGRLCPAGRAAVARARLLRSSSHPPQGHAAGGGAGARAARGGREGRSCGGEKGGRAAAGGFSRGQPWLAEMLPRLSALWQRGLLDL